MTKLLIFLVLLATIVALYFVGSIRKSAEMPSPTLIAASLPPCGEKPNCVCSCADENSEHYIEAIEVAGLSLEDLQQAVVTSGGKVTGTDSNLVTATYTSSLFGFIDDVLMLKTGNKIEVRSASRVGYSDLAVNRKRMEHIRHLLGAGTKKENRE